MAPCPPGRPQGPVYGRAAMQTGPARLIHFLSLTGVVDSELAPFVGNWAWLDLCLA